MAEAPPAGDQAFAVGAAQLPEPETQPRGLGRGWDWNETASGRNGAFLPGSEICWFTESFRTPHGDGGATQPFEAFLASQPSAHRSVPAGILVELVLAVWHRRSVSAPKNL